jgi:hypothetical protein
VAAEGETVAVRFTLAPSVGVVVEGVNVMVVAVVPPELLPVDPGACQKSPQPFASRAAANPNKMSKNLEESELALIAFFCFRGWCRLTRTVSKNENGGHPLGT